MFWSTSVDYKLNVTFDISTYCNAGCPQCDRTEKRGRLGKESWLPLINWSVDQFKQAIAPEDFRYIKTIAFTGSWGDPIMNKDIYKIVKYCVDHGCQVNIETNGSIRDENWWWEFGSMGGKLLKVRFDVDGINQEMHHKYRRFTSLQKVLDNMYMFSQTLAQTGTQTVVFKHNQDYLDEIEQLCREYGSTFHTKVISDRFDNNRYTRATQKNKEEDDTIKFYFLNENGEEEFLEKADRNIFKKPFIPGAFSKKSIIASEQEQKKIVHKEEQILSLDNEVRCRWAMPRNAIYVQNNGAIVPCCYIAWHHERIMLNNPENLHWFNKENSHPAIIELVEKDDEINVFKHSLKDILNKSEWYTKTFPNTIKNDKPMPVCERQCSNRIKKEHQLREDSSDL